MEASHALPIFLSFAEQIGQEILSNLNSDREKIQRSRDRVSVHVHAKTSPVSATFLHFTALVKY